MGITAYFRFNGNSNDSSGNGYNGSDTSITYQNGYAVFNGSAKIAFSAKFMPVGAKTIVARIYVPTGTSDGYLYDDDNAQSGYGNNIVIRISSGFYTTLWRYPHTLGYQIVSTLLFDLDKWNLLWVSWDGTNTSNAAKIYLNGKFAAQGTSTGIEDRVSQLNPFIGQATTSTSGFTGNVDTFWTANSQLSIASMKNEYARIKGFF